MHNSECTLHQHEADHDSALPDMVNQPGVSKPDSSQMCANMQGFGSEDKASENIAGSVLEGIVLTPLLSPV